MPAAARSVAAYAIVVDAKDDCGRTFYESHGFIPLPSRPDRLFLPAEVARRCGFSRRVRELTAR